MRTKPITIAEVEFTAFELAKELMSWNEPIPDFGTRFPKKLESCLETPFGKFSKKDLYKGLVGKASILFYLMIKNHPFQNGNKRIAVMTLLVFLVNNKKWLRIDENELYQFAVKVAGSKASEYQKILLYIQYIIRNHLADMDELKE